jgi:hypothetical protein
VTGSEPVVVSRLDHDQGEVPGPYRACSPPMGSPLIRSRSSSITATLPPSRESLSDRIVLKSVSAETMARPSRAAREDLLVGRCLYPEIFHVRNVLSGYGELPGDDR